MSGTDTAIAELSEPTDPAERGPPRPAALPYLTVANARDAIAWYVDALGAVIIGEPYRDGRRPYRTRRARTQWRRALSGRRVSGDRTESVQHRKRTPSA